MRFFLNLLGISYRDHITNEEVETRIGNAIGPYEKKQTEVVRARDTIIWTGQDYPTGNSSRRETRRRGRQRKRREDNIKEWTGLEWNIPPRKAENREEWRKLVVKSTVVPPTRSQTTGWMKEMK